MDKKYFDQANKGGLIPVFEPRLPGEKMQYSLYAKKHCVQVGVFRLWGQEFPHGKLKIDYILDYEGGEHTLSAVMSKIKKALGPDAKISDLFHPKHQKLLNEYRDWRDATAQNIQYLKQQETTYGL